MVPTWIGDRWIARTETRQSKGYAADAYSINFSDKKHTLPKGDQYKNVLLDASLIRAFREFAAESVQ